jgi:hypothetical protein
MHRCIGSPVCQATTNSSSVATCTLSIANLGVLLLTPSYTAFFAGSADYLASSAQASIKVLWGLL